MGLAADDGRGEQVEEPARRIGGRLMVRLPGSGLAQGDPHPLPVGLELVQGQGPGLVREEEKPSHAEREIGDD